jgi:predicted enzyme related to lactoylglutathione lyase
MAEDIAGRRPGTPCWVILVTPDPGRTGSFYAGLFGWSVPPAGARFAAVADCDAAATLADGLGGEVCAPPHDGAGLRLAVLRDPLGALFYTVEPMPRGAG